MTSLFVISPVGIYRIIEPFRLVVKSEEIWKPGKIVLASEVRYHLKFIIIFKVDGEWYSYRHFGILL